MTLALSLSRSLAASLVVALAPAPAPAPSSTPAGDAPAQLEARPQQDLNEARAREAWQAGVKAYGEGRLEQAIAHFEETYRYSARPGPLFSLGQAHRHRFEETGDARQRHLAIVRFEQYLEAEPEGKRALEAERHLAELLPLSALELEGPGEAPIFTRLSVSSEAAGASLAIDDLDPIPLPAAPDVAPGEHRVVVRAPGYHPWSRSVEVPEGSTITLEVPLQQLDARLTITGSPGASLYIDGQLQTRLSSRTSVHVPPGTRQLGVARSGRALYIRELELARGEQLALDVQLEVTAQRKISFAAMGVGGGGMIAASVLLGLTLDAQRRALAIEDERMAAFVSAAQDDEMTHLVARRDALRSATIASGVTGLVVLAAGVILYLTDQPAVHSRLHGDDRAARRTLSLRPGRAGALLRAEF